MKYRSRETTEQNLKRFFSNTSSDSITAEEAYLAWGRDLDNEKKNKNWLSSFLSHLKHYELVKPVYSTRDSWRIMDGIKLTDEGKRALGRGINNQIDGSQTNQDDLMKMVAKYKKDHPEYEVNFNVKLRNSK